MERKFLTFEAENMFSAVLKTIKAGKKSEDTIEFNSSELKENNFVWDFLNSQIELLDGSLREVVIDLHNGRTRTLEFAGGTITVPSNLNCDINLYNHFKEYFQVDYKIQCFSSMVSVTTPLKNTQKF